MTASRTAGSTALSGAVPRPRLLVVGGTGFIGRHVVHQAQALGWSVTTMSLGQSRGGEDVKHIAVDLTDRAAVSRALSSEGFEYVVNCGGYIDHRTFTDGGRALIDAHFIGVMHLVEALAREPLRGFVNVGSSDEYGGMPAPQREDVREAPISPYSLGKVAATHFLQMISRTEAFPATTLRLFLTYGPGQDMRRFLPQIIRGCLDGASFPVSAGEQLRDFCFVDDTIAAIFAALDRDEARGEVINVGSGSPISIRRMIELVRELVGRGAPRFGEIAYRAGENMRLYPDTTKAAALLGWAPRVPLDEGLRRTIESIRSAT